MPYSSWSVVFGEQPSAAKWNILGSNDAHFNDLIGKVGNDTVLNNIPYQANTTNSVRDSVLIQHGYGVMAGTTSDSVLSETVTFPTAYDSAPVVLIAFGGDDTGSGTTLGDGGNEIEAGLYVKARTVTTTTFIAQLNKIGSNFGANGTFFYHWLAIGVNT